MKFAGEAAKLEDLSLILPLQESLVFGGAGEAASQLLNESGLGAAVAKLALDADGEPQAFGCWIAALMQRGKITFRQIIGAVPVLDRGQVVQRLQVTVVGVDCALDKHFSRSWHSPALAKARVELW